MLNQGYGTSYLFEEDWDTFFGALLFLDLKLQTCFDMFDWMKHFDPHGFHLLAFVRFAILLRP